jgi:Asp-tRNA(Asn)/Glu-tRNA(Gln) amidotransferase A subunit family amidase
VIDLVDHVEGVCDLVETVDPRIHSLIPEPDCRARLREEACGLPATFADPASRPPLFGALVGVKDIFHVDKFPTRAGSALPPELFAGAEAAVVRSLRQAGAIVLGKTVTTEFAFFAPGPTRNPHDLTRTPGGSSSGSAAAVAAGFCPVALGTQTIGSVIRPAAYCGVVGFKPSFGRVSTAGVVPFSVSADTVGFFTHDVEGMALLASVAVPCWRDASPRTAPPVIGIPAGTYMDQASSEGLERFWLQVERIRRAGLSVRETPLLRDITAVNARHRLMVAAEFAQVHHDWFARYGDLYAPVTRDLILEGQQVSATELELARVGRASLRAEIHDTMVRSGIDLWLSPSAQGEAPEGLESTGSPIMNFPWTHAGLPSVSLPAGRSRSGLPLGLQLVARFGVDEQLLAWARALEENLS